jgi:DtxR family Mn-dependent transcriptional regulator
MVDETTRAEQDYLKTIYEQTSQGGEATTSGLAARLSVAPASVTGMLKKLASQDPPLIVYQKHQGATLTPLGKSIALEVIRHHRLIELFLMKALDFSWDAVHEEADRLEHDLSDALEQKIAAFLDHPSQDPHGAPIPNEALVIEGNPWVALKTLQPGQRAVVQAVSDENPELLRYLAQHGVTPKTGIAILAFSPLDQNLTIQVDGQPEPVVFGPSITCHVFVEVQPSQRN